MGFQYNRVLLIGATSGIGAALANKLVQEGTKVIAVGRRQERLDAFVKRHASNQSADRARSIQFDITDRKELDSFVKRVVEEYPDLDCVFLNSGVMSQTRLSRPKEVDLDAFHREIDVNFSSMVNLSLKFMPHLLEKDCPTSLIFTGSGLGLIPAVAMPAYSASKAALWAFVDCLRAQNRGTNVKIMNVMPTIVQTELHDYMGDRRPPNFGMPIDEFTEEFYRKLQEGNEYLEVGVNFPACREEASLAVESRNKGFDKLTEILLANFEL